MDQDRAQSSMMTTRNPLALRTQWKVDQSREFTLEVERNMGGIQHPASRLIRFFRSWP